MEIDTGTLYGDSPVEGDWIMMIDINLILVKVNV